MDNANDSRLPSDQGMSNSDEVAKNLLKLEQLAEFGCFFSDDAELNGDIKDETLQSILLNEEPESPLISSDGDGQRVDFGMFHEYVSSDLLPSLSSSEHQNTNLIEVFPLSDNVLITTNIGDTGKKTPVFLNVPDLVESNNVSIQTVKPGAESATTRKKSSSPVGRPTGKKIKVCRLVSHPKSKIEMPSVHLDLNDLGNPIENGSEDLANGESELNDNTELENRINDSLLDMLQKKMDPCNSTTDSFCNPERKIEKEILKFITITPPNPGSKTINLMLSGKNCRSTQPLTSTELRIVTKILRYENTRAQSPSERSYKNVYYDAESDTNIRYEVKYELAPEENASSSNFGASAKSKTSKTRNGELVADGHSSKSGDKDGYVVNSVARTRCGRISRPPRHVIRDYKRLKQLNESTNDVEDENENNGGYADYRDSAAAVQLKEKEKRTEKLYGPLEPNKRQFSSLSRCPTCGKIYLGYRRMAVHFQKYPEHTNEELLRRLLNSAKKKSVSENGVSANLMTTNEEVPGNLETGTVSSPHSNGVLRKKGRMRRRFKMHGSENGALDLNELLSTCRVEEVIKYAAPVVAGVLGSWEYLLIRSKQLKKDNETLVTSLLTELSVVLRRIRSLSDCLLKPCSEDKENHPSVFKIEEEDVLQYVLGVAPGSYLISENDDWAKDPMPKCNKVGDADSANELSSPLTASRQNENLFNAPDKETKSNNVTTMVDSLYDKLSDPAASTSSVTDLVLDLKDGLDSTSNTVSVPTSDIGQIDQIIHTGDSDFGGNQQNCSFGDLNSVNLKDDLIASTQLSDAARFEPKNLASEGGDEASRQDYVSQTFSPSHAFSFDSLVGNVNVDDEIINDFHEALYHGFYNS